MAYEVLQTIDKLVTDRAEIEVSFRAKIADAFTDLRYVSSASLDSGAAHLVGT